LKEPAIMQKRSVSFYSEGCRLAGDIFLPDDVSTDRPRAGIVLCHGYTGIKDLYLPDNAARLVEEGYVAMVFDYKGWGESDTAVGLEMSGARSRLAPYSRVADVQAAITFLGAQPEVDEDKIGIYGTSYGGATVTWVAAVDKRVKCTVSVVGIGQGERWMSRVRRPYEWVKLLEKSKEDRIQRAETGRSRYSDRNEILLPDPDSLRLATAARQQVKGAVSEIPMEYVDDTVGFNPEWIVDKIAPRPILFITSDNDLLVLPEESEELYKRAGEPKKLVVLKGYSHYEVYAEPAFGEVMAATVEWFRHYLPPR
jgi:fermentation-respiration switch protein FrsA (DUF1100 family)